MSEHHYLVYTPTFTAYHGSVFLMTEPPEETCDVVEVIAPNRRAARVAAVREMRRQHMTWIEDQQSDGASPFTGLKVDDMRCTHGICHCATCGGDCEACYNEAVADA